MFSNNASNFYVGWDIGGAHLKAVQLNANGEVLNCMQLPCPLWKGLIYLQQAIDTTLLAFKIAPYSACHAITMTGELVDLFENRHQGVCEIAKVASYILGEQIIFYAAGNTPTREASFVHLQDVHLFTGNIASANWHASASVLAKQVSDALLIDIGSTTTDIIVIKHGKVTCEEDSDAMRMQADTLIYTGVVRTPVMVLAHKLPFGEDKNNAEINVAAELFATMADVYRLTGELVHDDAETADGKGKTQLESARRLARMIGHDVDNSIEAWIKLAFTCRAMQIAQIKKAVLKHLEPGMTIIGAGAGSFLVKQIAAELNYESNYDFKYAYELASMRLPEDVTVRLQANIDICFPAYAVAMLAAEQSSKQSANQMQLNQHRSHA